MTQNPDNTRRMRCDTIASPLSSAHRVGSLDVLRGVAVLGILVMNIRNYGLSLREFDNPRHAVAEGAALSAADLWTWALANVLFEDKMIAIFSMLFGAGIVVFGDRLVTTGRSVLLHFRRMFWLFIFGLAHAYLLWYGDILNTYAVCGVFLWPLRKLRAGLLIGLGVIVLSVGVWTRVGSPMLHTLQPPEQVTAQKEPSASQQIFRRAIAREEQAYRAGYIDLLKWRADLNTAWHWYGCIEFNFWRCAGFMVVGMGLLRLGVLSASLPANAYAGIVLAGYGAGMSLTLLGFYPVLMEAIGRAPPLSGPGERMLGWVAWPARYFGAAGVAMGHVGVVMLACRALGTTRLLSPLAAVGRMALSNYLMHTVICVLIFDGWAWGQWDGWRMSDLYLLVAGIWLVQLVLSPLWLRWFRFGPAEWLWRSLTYWRRQPLRASPVMV